MGIVHLAQDVALLRPVAIKTLLPELARRPEVRERFLREARTVAALSHPNIVPIHAVEEHGDLLFFVMGYVEGESLRERVQRTGLVSHGTVTTMVRDIAWALGYAHGRGVIHRDVKPDNILIERATGRALLMDFGIARRDTEQTLSGAGELVGTLQYMSPEQAAGETTDGRSDLYSLGLTALFALTGRPPVEAGSIPALLARVVQGPTIAVDALVPQAPDTLKHILGTMVARAPDDRPASIESLAQTLDARAPETIAPAVRSAIQTCRSGANLFAISLVFLLPPGLGAFDSTPSPWLWMGVLAPLASIWSGWYSIRHRIHALVREGFRFAEIERAVAIAHREMEEVLVSDVLHEASARRRSRRSTRITTLIFGGMAFSALVLGSTSIASVRDPSTVFERTLRFVITAGGLLPADLMLLDVAPLLALAVLLGGTFYVLRRVRRSLWKIKHDVNDAGEKRKGVIFLARFDPAYLLTARWGRWTFRRAERRQQRSWIARKPIPDRSRRSETIALDRVADALALLPAALQERLGDVLGLARSLDLKAALLRQRLAAAESGLAARHRRVRRTRRSAPPEIASSNGSPR